MKSKLLLIISCLLLAVLTLSGCNSSTDTAATTDNSDDVFIIGVDDQFPPLGYRDADGNIVGFDIDLAKEAAERLGMELEVQQIDWSAKELELSQGNIDAIWNGLTITPERAEQMLFTDPYLENDQVVVVANGSDIKSISDLAGKTVGLQKSSSAEEALEADPIADEVAEVVSYDENVSALQDLALGRTDAVVVDSVVANWYIADNDADYTILSESLSPEQYGVAVAKDNEELRDKLNEILAEIKSDGTGAKISEEWFGSDILYTE